MISKLIQEYSDTTLQLRRYRESLDRSDPDQADESKLVSGMISDMQYALFWMRLGRRPGNRKGAERKDIYRQRELITQLQPTELPDKERLAVILLTLTERERLCFLLHMAQGLTYAEIADRLKVSKASVQKFVNRAKSKVQQGLAS